MSATYDRDYFRGKGSNYSRYEDKAKTIKARYLPKILQRVTLNEGSTVLDVGCAYGFFLKLCDRFSCATYGIDISKHAIEKARKETSAELSVQDVEQGLHIFKDSFFDLITAFDLIEHLRDPSKAMREFRRVLKPRGKIALTTPNLRSIERYLMRIMWKEHLWHGFHDKTHILLFTPTSLRAMIERNGFSIIELETPFNPFPLAMQKALNKTGLGGQIWILAEKL
jgi:2-polyprenyl-3-methyl-5-hydroxy-6-metoxy-1,4-benzoquinol methylase